EIVVQTMTDAIRDIARFNPKKSTLSSWLYGIARRRIQTEWRHSKRLKAWLLG
ncbi:MAG: RNA polymerase subunit sigma-70, partial [Armatimonadetes bacterium]|nr:RNA polymerase subunit sigma-70 [Armatimonadota bacterium]NIO76588.1 RNA polymerase subunit sigma-70 [Armatimonadota bacterium]NIO96220.1 RNA polymerase subunit sigma-70 [Armatimonadota bacterium]